MFLTMEEELESEPINCLVVDVEPRDGRSAAAMEAHLATGNPSIVVHLQGDRLIVDVECVSGAEAAVIGTRLREELTR